MSISKTIQTRIRQLPRGKPFTTSHFATHGPRGAVNRALSRIVRKGEIERLSRGAFVRPRKSGVVGTVLPGAAEVVAAIASRNGETIQVHGAEAVRRFGLSTQVPIQHVFHTNASSRSIRIGNLSVKLVHTSNRRRLQFAGEPAGLALSALWYLGKNGVTPEVVARIRSALGEPEFAKLRSADIPVWMADVLNLSNRGEFHA